MKDTSPPPDMQDLARSYLELWQDHLKAVAHDADISETLARTTALMSSVAEAFVEASSKAAGNEPGGASEADRATAAGAEPGGGDSFLDEFNGRIAAIEERVSQLESELAAVSHRVDGEDRPDDA
jgi:uncharacterized protein (DUF342 family)